MPPRQALSGTISAIVTALAPMPRIDRRVCRRDCISFVLRLLVQSVVCSAASSQPASRRSSPAPRGRWCNQSCVQRCRRGQVRQLAGQRRRTPVRQWVQFDRSHATAPHVEPLQGGAARRPRRCPNLPPLGPEEKTVVGIHRVVVSTTVLADALVVWVLGVEAQQANRGCLGAAGWITQGTGKERAN